MSSRPREAEWPNEAGRSSYRTGWLMPAGVVLITAAAGFTFRGFWPMTPSSAMSASASAVPVSSAKVARTDVAQRQVVSGTLGYRGTFSVSNELPPGIITWLPAAGQVIYRGQALYRIDGQSVTLLYGSVPAWRSFQLGMTPGADIRELNENLIALGFDPDRQITVDDQFDWATLMAVERWQQVHGMQETGSISLGQRSGNRSPPGPPCSAVRPPPPPSWSRSHRAARPPGLVMLCSSRCPTEPPPCQER